ncbi:MAG: cation:proton antiporter [Tenericutes bacterium]|nr:cation:proton antiporter [Mycoplasmatota bacterium]
MLNSLALIILLGLVSAIILEKIKLPNIIGMLIVGIMLGPSMFNMLDESLLSISGDIKEIALIIILLKAGLSLDLTDLKKVGRPAVLLCFLPATFEILGFIIFGPKLLGLTLLESAILGAVMGAVSPAVIVPRMTFLLENGYGKKGLPQMVIAGSSADDVYVIVIFTALLALAKGSKISIMSFLNIPISIILGILMGVLVGFIMVYLFKNYKLRNTYKVIILLSICFLFVSIEKSLEGKLAISGFLAIMAMGVTIFNKYPSLSKIFQVKFSKMWLISEIILFVLVGASVNISYAFKAGLGTIVIIFIALLFRMLGTYLCLLKTKFNNKERLFTCITQIPKATVQAAIGGVPLEMGLLCGNTVLTVAVLSIIITAPLGSILIDKTQYKLLKK